MPHVYILSFEAARGEVMGFSFDMDTGTEQHPRIASVTYAYPHTYATKYQGISAAA
jgi:hypothetical protein